MKTHPPKTADHPEAHTTITRIALVGHCSFDSASLTHAASRVPGVTDVLRINTEAELAQVNDGSTLLLVNRVLDGRFAVDYGVELIKRLAVSAGRMPPKMMLISNFEDAQADAVEAGALPGFGKNATHTPDAAAKLAAAVND